jgi:integrase
MFRQGSLFRRGFFNKFLDCALRPEECFRLRVENVTDSRLEIHFGKTANARRRIPMTPRVKAVLDMRLSKVSADVGYFLPRLRADTLSRPA